jgi:hypothetical protein
MKRANYIFLLLLAVCSAATANFAQTSAEKRLIEVFRRFANFHGGPNLF